MLHAQADSRVLLMDGKQLKKSDASRTADTVHIKAATLKKAKAFVIRFDSSKGKMWKRSTWLENEQVTDPSKYTYRLPSSNGSITIPASVVKTLLKGKSNLQIWTSLQPANDMMMVRESRDLIYFIMID